MVNRSEGFPLLGLKTTLAPIAHAEGIHQVRITAQSAAAKIRFLMRFSFHRVLWSASLAAPLREMLLETSVD